MALFSRVLRCSRMHVMEEDDEFQRLMLAKVLLGGYTENDARGLPRKKYLADESEARSALASILRNHQKSLDHDLRDMMAALFESGARHSSCD